MEDKDIVILNGKFLPPNIWQEQPGIDPQKQRAHHLKHKHLTPISFLNVLFNACVKIPCVAVVLTLIRFFMREFIALYFWQIFGVIAVILFVYVLYAQTIIKNAPDLEEELFFNGIVNTACFVAGFILSCYMV